MILTKREIEKRIEKFYSLMNEKCSDWDIAIILDRVNQYYFTGTMQNAVLVFTKANGMHFFVRKSYERAKIESPIENIYKINTFRDIPTVLGSRKYINGYIELNTVPIGLFNMINKHILL